MRHDRRVRACQRACAGLALVLAALGCGGDDKDWDKRPAPTVEVTTVEPELLQNVVEFVGQLDAESSVLVRPEIDGVIAMIEFEEGSEVAAGDVLVRLRDEEQVAALRKSEAQAELAAALYKRSRQLAKRDIAAKTDLEKARAEYKVTRAEVEERRVELQKTVIQAPFDCVVGARRVSPGERVNDDTILVRIDAIDRLQLVFTVPERSIRLAQKGGLLEVTVKPYPERVFPAEVFFVAPTIDITTRRALVKAWVPNPEHLLQPGLFADVRAEIGRKEDALIVPESAIVLDEQGSFVWRLDDEDRAWRAGVELGLRRKGEVELASGIEPGTRIVTAGTHKVSDGEPVRVAGASAPPPTAAADADVASDGEGS
jgi:membrane fusion protein (multidrug efflux system)